MIRKQVYLAREQDRKLKTLAARRGCTEAEVIRDALDRLSEPDEGALAQLQLEGLLAPPVDVPNLPRGNAAKAFLADYEQWLESPRRRVRDPRLTEAVLEDRGPR